jgi:hypothetical protein
MSREHFEVSIVPQTPGTVEEVLSRAPQGAVLRENYITELERRRDRMVKGIHGPKRKQQFLNWANSGIPARGEYQLDFSEKISPEDKTRIFLPAINAMRVISLQYGLLLPEARAMLEQVYIVDEETLLNAGAQETGNDQFYRTDALGTALPNGLCLVNSTAIATRPKTVRSDVLRQVGIHELWESFIYAENWIGNGVWSERRKGIMTLRPYEIEDGDRVKIADGYNRLKEGTIEYLTRLTLQEAGEKVAMRRLYEAESNLAKKLTERIGSDPLFQAMYTKRGFRAFHNILTNLYGERAYQRLGLALSADYRQRSLGFKLDQPSYYRRTKRFIEKSKS